MVNSFGVELPQQPVGFFRGDLFRLVPNFPHGKQFSPVSWTQPATTSANASLRITPPVFTVSAPDTLPGTHGVTQGDLGLAGTSRACDFGSG